MADTLDAGPRSEPLVYISVLNWNGAEKTIRCLESLRQLHYSNYRILVVDNASTDDSVARISATFPDTEILRSSDNFGYAGGNKLALDTAIQTGAELFWILNNDTVVESDTLTALVEAYQQHGLAIYGSVVLQPGNQRLVAFGGGWQLDANGRPRAIGEYNPLHGQPYEQCFHNRQEHLVDTVSGSSLMIPLAIIEKCGFMDESFFMYFEETDYCFRLGKQGVPSVLVPNSVVLHEGAGSSSASAQLRQVLRYYGLRNGFVFMWRHERHVAYLKLYRYFKINWRFLLFMLLAPQRACARSPRGYNEAVAIRHALLCRMGKYLAPEDYYVTQDIDEAKISASEQHPSSS